MNSINPPHVSSNGDFLPEALKALADMDNHTGTKCIVALFSGDQGTGKTVAAIDLASSRGAAFLRVKLTSVISKCTGETEKNLERLLRATESAETVVFFDEADAILGKGGETTETNDGFANFDPEYLLQRLKEFWGIVILAVNQKEDLDDAFVEKLSVIVEFPLAESSPPQLASGLRP